MLIIGTGYLALFGLGLEKALIAGFYPFLIGDVIKSSICAMIIAYSRKSS
ncbi:MAG: biotin transporter BioY [Fidelibacterota bacterium]